MTGAVEIVGKLIAFAWSWLWGLVLLGLIAAAFWLGVTIRGGLAFVNQKFQPIDSQAQEEAPSAPKPVLSLPNAAVQRADIGTTRVTRGPAVREVRMVGVLEADETLLEHITAWTDGRIEAQPVSVTGEEVVPGQVVVDLYSPELLRAHQELLEGVRALASVGEASSEFMRERAIARLESGREKLRQLGLSKEEIAELETEKTAREVFPIASRQGGTVTSIMVRTGDYVDTGDRMYMVADLRNLWLQLTAYESDLTWLRYGQRVEFEVESFPGRRFEGTVAFIHPILDEESRSVPVRVNVKNSDLSLFPGMFAHAVAFAQVGSEGQVIAPDFAGKWICPMHPEVVSDTPRACDLCNMPLVSAEDLGYARTEESISPLLVPAAAVLTEREQGLVYLVSEDSTMTTFSGRRVLLGPQVGDKLIVYSGLKEGDVIAMEGVFKVDSELQIRGQPSMMNLPYPAVPRPPSAELRRQGQVLGPAVGALLARYLEVSRALAFDDLTKAKEAAQSLAEQWHSVPDQNLSSSLLSKWNTLVQANFQAASELASADDLQGARQWLVVLTRSMIEATQLGLTTERNVAIFKCPMAFKGRGAVWLQDLGDTQNPYFGVGAASMFKCGELKEKLLPK